MVKVTIEFVSVDEAIVALAKLVGAPGTARRAGGKDTGVTDPRNAAPVATVTSTVPVPAPEAPTIRTRKPRADKGQERGPYTPREPSAKGEGTGAPADTLKGANTTADTARPVESGTGSAGGVAGLFDTITDATASTTVQTSTAAASQVASAAAPLAVSTPAAPVEPVPAIEAVTAALETLLSAKGLQAVQDVLSRSGVKRLRDLLPEHRATVIEDAKRVLAGGKA